MVRSASSSDWAGALAAAAGARLTLIIGDTDTGKTSLATALANALLARGYRVGVVDADLGQSEIGPPTTIGMGRVARPLGRLGEAELVALHFVGSISPAHDLVEAVRGTGRLVARALADGYDCVLVDTCGLVRGDLGRRFARATIQHVHPDVIVAREREGECEPIVGPYRAALHPVVVRLPALPRGRGRTPAQRRDRRAKALAGYFAGARPVALDLSRVGLHRRGRVAGAGRSGRQGVEDVDLVGRLAGLENSAGETLGLGVITGFDGAARTLTLRTGVPAGDIAAAVLGREAVSLEGLLDRTADSLYYWGPSD
jgi:polynucleotide 5'-kinase involved in rRNA processing